MNGQSIGPKVHISGDNYDVGTVKNMLSIFVGYLRLAIFILLFAGDSVWQVFGGIRNMSDAVKDINTFVQENKIQVGIGAFFLGTIIQNSLSQSGAFEIYINGNLEYSKLQTGNMPTV